MADECSHEGSIRIVTPSALGCEECLKLGSAWVHLRLCRTCGHVGCCDDSPHRHATRHFHATGHPIIEGRYHAGDSLGKGRGASVSVGGDREGVLMPHSGHRPAAPEITQADGNLTLPLINRRREEIRAKGLASFAKASPRIRGRAGNNHRSPSGSTPRAADPDWVRDLS